MALLYRIDMKSFFMSGEPIELARTVSACFNNAAQRDAMLDGIWFLLTHQYIVSDREQTSGRLWQIVKGTGMGLQHSSELANLTLLLLVEEGFAISRIVQERFGIVCYFRYFDDTFIVSARPSLFDSFYRRYKIECGCVTPEIVERDKPAVDVLNMRVCIRGSALHTYTIFKPSSLNVPLMSDSSHPPTSIDGPWGL
jgi:hypothetical protein